MDFPPTLRDVFAANLDANLEGIPSWEQFGEKLLNMDATELRQFQASDSPTKAVLNKKVATDPSATLEDAFIALEAIGRKDVAEIVLQKLSSSNLMTKKESFERPLSSLQLSQRHALVHQSSSTTSSSCEGTMTQNQPLIPAHSEYASAQHMPMSVGHTPVLTQTESDTANVYQKSNLPNQTSLDLPNQSTSATLPAQTPGIIYTNIIIYIHIGSS